MSQFSHNLIKVMAITLGQIGIFLSGSAKDRTFLIVLTMIVITFLYHYLHTKINKNSTTFKKIPASSRYRVNTVDIILLLIVVFDIIYVVITEIQRL